MREDHSRPWWVSLGLLALWLGVVLVTVRHHEFWRDEVRALSLARGATSLADLVRRTQDDGHPLLWYLLLYAGHIVVKTKLILPALSVGAAAAGAVVFERSAPFPLPLRAIFLFGALPLYEYSVMARNYGLGMLLLFLAALAFSRREQRPIVLALVLTLLANTSFHAALLACLLAGVWGWDTWTGPSPSRRRQVAVGLALVAAGVLLSAACALPRADSIVTNVYTSSPGRVAHALQGAALRPDWSFAALFPSGFPNLLGRLLLGLAIGGLLAWWPLGVAAAGAALSLGLVFRLVYFGAYRHQGLFLVFLLVLYWVAAERPGLREGSAARRWLLRVGLYAGVLPLLVTQLARSPAVIREDLDRTRSSSPALARFLRGSPAYRDAVLLPEPGWFLESLPYYAENRLYYPRERRYGTTVSWTRAEAAHLSLGQLLAAARSVEAHSGRPALIALGAWDPTSEASADKRGDYGQTFSWTASEREEFLRETERVADFQAATTDENYRVYALRDASGRR